MSQSSNSLRGLMLVCLVAITLASAGPAALAASGFSELYPFCQKQNCNDGQNPQGGLLADSSGNLYGTTTNGGANGAGTVFKVTPNGKETVLYSFCAKAGCKDGQAPLSNLIRDEAGNLYGTTYFGGASGGGGTVYKLAPDGAETVLYSFCIEQCAAGQNPVSGVIMDGNGNLYGTTRYGGIGYGTVFRLSPGGTETVLYAFGDAPDGRNPTGNLLLYNGSLYGTTSIGGANNYYGTVFRLSKKGAETVLYSFCSQPNCADGNMPIAGLVVDKSGNLYGTTQYGGASGAYGSGTVFELTPGGTETVLYSFTGGSDGSGPLAPLLLKSTRKGVTLYGTTNSSGSDTDGTVFKIANGMPTVLHTFVDDGCANPAAGLILYKGYFYGTSVGNYAPNNGCVFKLGTKGG